MNKIYTREELKEIVREDYDFFKLLEKKYNCKTYQRLEKSIEEILRKQKKPSSGIKIVCLTEKQQFLLNIYIKFYIWEYSQGIIVSGLYRNLKNLNIEFSDTCYHWLPGDSPIFKIRKGRV